MELLDLLSSNCSTSGAGALLLFRVVLKFGYEEEEDDFKTFSTLIFFPRLTPVT